MPLLAGIPGKRQIEQHMLDTRPLLLETEFPAIRRATLTTLQVNLGYLCNQTCTHCHVNAGPKRTELMTRDTLDLVIEVLAKRGIAQLDLTGGAPEMNPGFRDLVARASSLGVAVTDRCNLTILTEPGYEYLPGFLAEHGVAVTASLPCYSEQNVAEQRGKGVFEASVDGLRLLNELGYGREPALSLDLVYNPNGAFLPPSQQSLEAEYKATLKDEYGVDFNNLLTITNMPISRFGGMLLAKGEFDAYMTLLKSHFESANLAHLMCRSLVSVDWRGYLYDCDFNQMLALPMLSAASDKVLASDRPRRHLKDLLHHDISGQPITVGEHCFGCTAGQGSSCGGSLSA